MLTARELLLTQISDTAESLGEPLTDERRKRLAVAPVLKLIQESEMLLATLCLRQQRMMGKALQVAIRANEEAINRDSPPIS